ncbi:hypothetical protein ACKWTF_003230 [Chironomus riparius]
MNKVAKVLLFLVICGFSAINASPIPTSYRTADFNRYWTLNEINEYILDLGARFPNITEVEEMGITAENRTIYGIRIVNNAILQENNYSMPILLITAGATARDWISMMAAMNIIHELVEHYHEFRILVDYLEWFIVPVLNPDGYEFSRTEGNRAWTKNRRPNTGSNCIGVNIERNFDIYWDSDINSSADPCDDNFRGSEPASEEESRFLKLFFSLARPVEVAYISIQAGLPNTFNGAIAYPYAFSNEAIPNEWDRMQPVAHDMSGNVNRMTGARYRTGSASNLANPTSGTSPDYAKSFVDIPYVYTIFTNPSGSSGWDAPEWRINPTVDQVFAAIDDLSRHLIFSPTFKEN